MPDILKAIQKARGISNAPDPIVEAQRKREAQTREADYAALSEEVRPFLPGSLNLEDCRRLLAERAKAIAPTR